MKGFFQSFFHICIPQTIDHGVQHGEHHGVKYRHYLVPLRGIAGSWTGGVDVEKGAIVQGDRDRGGWRSRWRRPWGGPGWSGSSRWWWWWRGRMQLWAQWGWSHWRSGGSTVYPGRTLPNHMPTSPGTSQKKSSIACHHKNSIWVCYWGLLLHWQNPQYRNIQTNRCTVSLTWPEQRAGDWKWALRSQKPWQPADNTHCSPAPAEKKTGPHSQWRRCSCLQRCRSLGPLVCTQRNNRNPEKTDSQGKILGCVQLGVTADQHQEGHGAQRRVDTTELHNQDQRCPGFCCEANKGRIQPPCGRISPWLKRISPKRRENGSPASITGLNIKKIVK